MKGRVAGCCEVVDIGNILGTHVSVIILRNLKHYPKIKVLVIPYNNSNYITSCLLIFLLRFVADDFTCDCTEHLRKKKRM